MFRCYGQQTLNCTAVARMRRTEALASVKFYQILSIFIFFIRLIILEDFIRLISYNGPCVRLGCSFFLATALNWIKERQKRCPLRGSKCHCLSPKFWFIPNNVNLRYSMRLERKPDYFAKLYLLVKVKGLLPYIKLSIFFQLLPA